MVGAIADEIYAMLLAQASTPPIYQEKCRGCHQNAAELARTSLAVVGGKAAGRQSGRPLADSCPAMPASTPMSFPSSLKASPVSIARYTVRTDDVCVHSFTEPLPSPSLQPQARCRVSMCDGTAQVRQSTRNDRHACRDHADAEHTVQKVAWRPGRV